MSVNNQVILWIMELRKDYPRELSITQYIEDHNKMFGQEYWNRFEKFEDLEHEFLSYRKFLRSNRGMK